MKSIVVKVDIYCQKCRTGVLKAVAKLEGVDQVSNIDDEKGTLTVVGSVNPVLVAKKVRKTGKMAKILSVGPPKKPDTPNPPIIPLQLCCTYCHFVPVEEQDIHCWSTTYELKLLGEMVPNMVSELRFCKVSDSNPPFCICFSFVFVQYARCCLCTKCTFGLVCLSTCEWGSLVMGSVEEQDIHCWSTTYELKLLGEMVPNSSYTLHFL